MKNVIITGATGMTGVLILGRCLASEKIGKVTAITRKPTGIIHEKLTEVIHHDFTDFRNAASHFKDQDIAFFCLGVYTGAVDRDTFRKISVDYTKVFAKTLKKESPEAAFCFLSGQGADRTEKSRMMFAKDKGIAENHLIEMNFEQLYIFRPAYIYPVTPRQEPNLSYKIMRLIYPVYKTVYPNGVIESTDLAGAMFTAGLEGAGKTTLENRDIKNIAAGN